MTASLSAVGIEVTYYPVVYGGYRFEQNTSPAEDADLVLVMGFFGLSGAPSIPEAFDGIVVEDVTHSLFSLNRPTCADYYFGSLRKWGGFWTGGFAWKNSGMSLKTPLELADEQYVMWRRQAMEQKANYITAGEGDKDYLRTFERAEEWLDKHVEVMQADKRDVQLAGRLDVDTLRATRRENASILLDGLRGIDGVTPVFPELRDGDCPLFVPVLVEGRDSLRRYLIERDVFCPVHWPVPEVQALSRKTSVFYERELSLVCDQRYGTDDMFRICDLVREWRRTL